MPNSLQPRTPGYRFKDGRLMIFREDEVMLIRGWEEPSAVCKRDDVWEPFVPEFRLFPPYRRAVKKNSKKVVDERPLTGIHSMEKALQLHAEVVGDFQKLDKLHSDQGLLPPPPAPGTKGKIETYTNVGEAMGQAMVELLK